MEETRLGEPAPALSARVRADDPDLAPHLSRLFPPAAPAEPVLELLTAWTQALRGPLSNISAFAGLVLDGSMGPLTERQAVCLQSLLASGEDVERRLMDMQVWVGLHAGSLTLESAEVSLSRLVVDVADRLHPLATARGIGCEMVIEGTPVVRGDTARLAQALGHLLENALRHGPAGTTVRVRARVEGDRAIVSVEDRGTGPDAEVRAALEDAWRRAGELVARRASGAGMGLALAWRIALAHGGTLAIQDLAPQGCAARLELPAL